MTNQEKLKEVNEAYEAGVRALSAMESAAGSLSSARRYGAWDMFGGGLIAGMMKHSKIDKAQAEMQYAANELSRFRKELNDVDMHINCGVEISSTLKGFDIFFDDIFSDFAVQSKIKQMQFNVDEVIAKIRSALETLQLLQHNLSREGQV